MAFKNEITTMYSIIFTSQIPSPIAPLTNSDIFTILPMVSLPLENSQIHSMVTAVDPNSLQIGEKLIFTLNLLVDMVGILLFVALVRATIRNKTLHSTCHLLIGFYSICSICSKTIIIPTYLLTMFPAIPSMPLYLCAIFKFVPYMGQFCLFPLMLAIGVDRIFSVFSAIWYTQRNDRIYLPIIIGLSILYTLIFSGSIILMRVIQMPMMETRCNLDDLYGAGTIQSLSNYTIMGMNVGTILCYAIIMLKLFCLNDGLNGPLNQTRLAILKSLALIMCIQVGGWTIMLIGINLLYAGIIVGQKWFYMLTTFSSFCSTVEVPVLYFTSSEHRLALRSEFKFLRRFFRRHDNVGNSNNMVIIRSPNAVAVSSSSFYTNPQR